MRFQVSTAEGFMTTWLMELLSLSGDDDAPDRSRVFSRGLALESRSFSRAIP